MYSDVVESRSHLGHIGHVAQGVCEYELRPLEHWSRDFESSLVTVLICVFLCCSAQVQAMCRFPVQAVCNIRVSRKLNISRS
jgi:hypothetical protein